MLGGRALPHTADTVDMVAARDRVHIAGFLDPVVAAVADAAREASPDARLVADLGSGPGHYLRAVLRAVPAARGLGFDVSKSSARAVVRGQPPAAAVVGDVWSALPLGADVADVALSVFAPRNPDETARILRPGGMLVMVTPQPDHLCEIIEPMGMLSVAADKDDRIAAAMTPAFETTSIRDISWVRDADAALLADLAGMGPSAFHSEADRFRATADRLIGAGDGPVAVTGAVRVRCLRPRRPEPPG